jgi:hypothetical protein
LLLCRLRLDEAHLWPLRRDHDGLGVRRIVLLALHERLHVMRSDQFHLMAKANYFAGPVMRAATGFHHHDRWSLLGHESEKHLSRQLLPKLQMPGHRGCVKLENILCQINSNHRIFCHGCRPFRSVAVNTTSWHIAMPSGEGGNHPI